MLHKHNANIDGPKVSTIGGPPEDPDEHKKTNSSYPYGKYEDAPYHHKNSRRKNPAPKNGQKALDNSIECPKNTRKVNTSNRRIGISEGEIVVLDRTSLGKYHGHVRTWNELEEFMQKALERAGLAKNGKII